MKYIVLSIVALFIVTACPSVIPPTHQELVELKACEYCTKYPGRCFTGDADQGCGE